MGKEQLIVFVKAPRPGQVKTRLAQEIGAVAACDAYLRLVAQVLANIQGIKVVQLRYSPDNSVNEIESWLKAGWECRPQRSGDLGDRLNRAFEEGFHEKYKKIVIIGSDCPEVTKADIVDAWAALDNSDVVLGPAFDGGYWLIGLKRNAHRLFQDIAWSSTTVLEDTLKRAEEEGMTVKLLQQRRDVDTRADWDRVSGLIP